ncbi:conjugal transfer protein TraD [Novosphingobium sp. SG751A]|uniref:conjugal transfer protein TraD n=1 Tax=Novosphingobium sp. SG751A TaxID=2587000 RepID=UPI00155540B5
MARRERTRHLIELGGLVQKAGLVGIADDDRAMLYGAFLEIAQRMQSDEDSQFKLLLRRRGARAFATDAEQTSASRNQRKADGPRNKMIDGDHKC